MSLETRLTGLATYIAYYLRDAVVPMLPPASGEPGNLLHRNWLTGRLEWVGFNTFGGAQSVAPVALAISAGSVAVDAQLSNNFTLYMSESATLENPTNLVAGTNYTFVIRQVGGGCTLAYGSLYKFAGGAPALSAAENACDMLCAHYDGIALLCAFAKGYA